MGKLHEISKRSLILQFTLTMITFAHIPQHKQKFKTAFRHIP